MEELALGNSTPAPTTALSAALPPGPGVYDEEAGFCLESAFAISRSAKGSREIKPQRSLNDLEIEELQGFRDLGFEFREEELCPKVISILPGLRTNKRSNVHERNTTGKPYLSEAWQGHDGAYLLRWGSETSREEIKAQIKTWARAVAIMVRQEC